MARVAALIPDLLFGSKVQAALTQAGHDVDLIASAEAWDADAGVEVLVVDLTDAAFDGVGVVVGLAEAERLGDARTLGFFAHVEPEVRERALAAGFDQVVPRSRMAREGAELVERLCSA